MALGQEEIGRRVREARELAELTQQELADAIGIKQGQTISNYERGITDISPKRLRRIAETTNKPLGFFIRDPEAAEPEPEGVAAVLLEIAGLREEVREIRGAVQRLEERLPPGEESSAANRPG